MSEQHPVGKPFASLAELREQHTVLLRERSRIDAPDTPDGPDAAWRERLQDFIRRGQATGIYIEGEEERWEAQSLLDYWGAAIYRLTARGVPTALAEYDPSRANEAAEALADSADAAFGKLSPEQQSLARRILVRLARLPEGTSSVLPRVRREALHEGSAPDAVDLVLARLGDAGVVRVLPGETAADDRFELTQPTLRTAWKLLLGWLQEERDREERRSRFRAAAEQWDAHGRDPGGLIGGLLLDEAHGYSDLAPLEREFLEQSRLQAERQAEAERQQLKEYRRLSSHLTVAMTVLILGGMTIVAGILWFTPVLVGFGYLIQVLTVGIVGYSFVRWLRFRLSAESGCGSAVRESHH